MSQQKPKPPESIELLPATLGDQPAISNLYQLYIHDFSDYVEQKLGDDGRFGYDPLPPYWTEPDRFPFLIRVDGSLAGFALVRKGSVFSGKTDIWDMADFFVVRGARGIGVGYVITKEIWRRFPGPWEVRVLTTNLNALTFWSKAISRFTGHPLEPILVTDGEDTRYLFLFAAREYTPS